MANRRVFVALALLFVFWLAVEFCGLDFGKHWDEGVALHVVAESYRSPRWLPAMYAYPSFIFDLIGLALSPWHLAERLGLSAQPVSARLDSGEALLALRAVFVLFASLSLLFAFLLSRALSGSRREGLLAALLLAGSFEFGYHARWVACDVLVASFATLALWLGCESVRRESRRYLLLAAAATGMATASKYPAGLLTVPLTVAALEHAGTARRKAASVLLCALVVATTYFAAAPGTLLNHGRFVFDVTREIRHYATGHPGGHGLEPGLLHLRRIAEYWAFAGLSPFRASGVILSCMAGAGAGWLLCRSPRRAALVLAPLALLASYMSLQRVFIVRNLVWMLPLLAVLAARGFGVICALLARSSGAAQLPRRARTSLCALAVAALMVPNLAYVVLAAWSIRWPRELGLALESYLVRHPELEVQFSARLARKLGRGVVRQRIDAAQRADVVAALGSELVQANNLDASRHGLLLDWIGPYEVNLNYYPSWMGREHIVLLTQDRALAMKLR